MRASSNHTHESLISQKISGIESNISHALLQTSDQRDKEVVRNLQSALQSGNTKNINHTFNLLYKKYYHKLHAFLSQSNHSYDDREDVIADTFVQVLKNIARYKIGDAKFSGRLMTIAFNKNIDFFRQRKRQVDGTEFGDLQKYVHIKYDCPNALDHLLYESTNKKLQQGINTLRGNAKHMYDLRFEKGCSYKEIADILQIPLGTVTGGIFAIRKKLAKILHVS